MTASTISSATCTPWSRSSAACDWTSARVANAAAAHGPRPGLPRRGDPPPVGRKLACQDPAEVAGAEDEQRGHGSSLVARQLRGGADWPVRLERLEAEVALGRHDRGRVVDEPGALVHGKRGLGDVE